MKPGTIFKSPPGAEKPIMAGTTGRFEEAEAGMKSGSVAAQGAEAGQKPMQAPATPGEDQAKAKAEAASKGPTATPTDTTKAPGPSVAPHPKKPNLFKRIIAKLTRKKRT